MHRQTGLEVERKKCPYGLRIEAPKAPRRWGIGRGFPLHSPLGGLGSVVSSPSGDGAEPPPKTILVRSEGARTALVAMHATEMT